MDEIIDPQELFEMPLEEVADIIESGLVSIEQLYASGFPEEKKNLLNALMKHREDDEDWMLAARQASEQAYTNYLAKYDVAGGYRGKYILPAQIKLAEYRDQFDPMKLFSYPVEKIATFIRNGQISKEELYMNGFPAAKRPQLEGLLVQHEEMQASDESDWIEAVNKDTIEAFNNYKKKYFGAAAAGYMGAHVLEAHMRIKELKKLSHALRIGLFKEMKERPWEFKAETIQYLLRGVHDEDLLEYLKRQDDITSRFIATGGKISFDDIVRNGIIPSDWTEAKLMAPDYALPQTNIDELGDFPTDSRTDVYFLGVPRGGKSSVLAGIFYEMFRRGIVTYQPQFNKDGVDRCNPYYKGLIRSVESAKFPVSTNTDSLSFMKVTLNANKRENPLTFVEISGEAFSAIAGAFQTGADVWSNLGAAQCLNSKNRKLIAFIVDYSISRGDVREDRNVWTDMEQSLVLDGALSVFSNDGKNPKDRSKGCTLEKADTIAVIVTKSDLMGDDLTTQERVDKAVEYLRDKFSNFMQNLTKACEKFGINRPIGFKPYVMTFSLGKLQIGNTYSYEAEDASRIIDFISRTTTAKKRGFFF